MLEAQEKHLVRSLSVMLRLILGEMKTARLYWARMRQNLNSMTYHARGKKLARITNVLGVHMVGLRNAYSRNDPLEFCWVCIWVEEGDMACNFFDSLLCHDESIFEPLTYEKHDSNRSYRRNQIARSMRIFFYIICIYIYILILELQ